MYYHCNYLYTFAMNRIISISMKFKLKTIDLRQIQFYNDPDCYDLSVKVCYV